MKRFVYTQDNIRIVGYGSGLILCSKGGELVSSYNIGKILDYSDFHKKLKQIAKSS